MRLTALSLSVLPLSILVVAPLLASPTLTPVAPWVSAQELASIDSIELPALDREALAFEDDLRRALNEPYRFALSHEMTMRPDTHGTWSELPGGLRVWRLRVRSSGAESLNFGFSRFELPAGAELSIVSADGQSRLGPYTAADQQPHGELWTPVVLSDDVVLELVVAAAEGPVRLELATVNQGYRGFRSRALKSGACNVDVVCPEGNGWRDQIRGVARYTRSGAFLCSGSLINNTANDARPLFLTADHCGITAGNAASVVLYWNYENSTCRAPGSGASGGNGDGNLGQSQSGSVLRARYAPSDMSLIELSDAPNPAWNVYWAGWDRRNLAPPSAVAIHHPQGQEKRISFENQPTSVTTYLSDVPVSGGTHIRVADWDLGTTEGGSSGSPLFNPDKRIVGQLHGGFAACGNDDDDWYGFMATSWGGGGSASSRLSDWLDPLGTGASTLNGIGGATGPSPPAAPSSLTATALSDTEVRLVWQDNSSNETSFVVEQSTGFGFTVVGNAPTNATMTTVSGLQAGTNYSFRIKARGAGGDSGYSNVASATTAAGVPTSPRLQRVSDTGADGVLVEWQDRSTDEVGFVVEARDIAAFGLEGEATVLDGGWTQVASVGADETSVEIQSVSQRRLANYRVRAMGSAGDSAPSDELPAMTRSTQLPATCQEDVDSLCLLGDRYRVEAVWKNQHGGGATGFGRAVPSTDRAGYFWFFNPNNLELVVKLLPGGSVNGFSWLFYGALSDVEYWIVATDLMTGETASYYNAPADICGQADLFAFAQGSSPQESVAVTSIDAGAFESGTKGFASCVADDDTLCLLDDRFAVDVSWDNQHDGSSGVGRAIQPTTGDQTGFFWFFNAANIELIVKMIDGRSVNGKFWFFYGALSDVEYDITVTDTQTGRTAEYHNNPGNICGVGDTAALDG